MPHQINRAGVTTVKVVTDGSTLEDLGICTDMPETRDQAFYHDVHSDEHGGPQGPPIDTQYLGRIVHVRCEMSKYDRNVLKKVRARLRSSGAANQGNVLTADIGKLMFQDSLSMRVLLSNANDPQNFPIVIMREPIEVGYGTKHSTLILEFEGHRNQTTGLLADAVIS